MSVRVVSPEQAIREIISMLDATIAAEPHSKVRMKLEEARRVLKGTNQKSKDGALHMVINDYPEAAIAFLSIALTRLDEAEALGSNTVTIELLIQQVIVALSAG